MNPRSHDRDDRLPSKAPVNPASLGDALSDLPVPDHGPTFWADLDDRLQGETVQHIESGEHHLPPPSTPGPADPVPSPDPRPAETVSLEEERARRAARRGGRFNRSLGAAAAAVALILGVVGGLNVIRDDKGTDIQAADPPATGTPGPSPSTTAPMTQAPFGEFSATYDGIEGRDGPNGCCSQWRLTLAQDGSFRWASTDSSDASVYDSQSGMHWEVMTWGAGASKNSPSYFISGGVPAGGPDQGVGKPEPLNSIADFIVALARAGDSRITTSVVAGRPAWHYDGPTVQDRLGGDGAPNHAVADVDQTTGVLLELTRRVGDQVISRFTVSDVSTSDKIDRTHYWVEVPAGAQTNEHDRGFRRSTLDEAASGLPYDLLVPRQVPDGFTIEAVSIDRDVPSQTGPEGMNPPAKQIVAMTWNHGAQRFTVTLRPKGSDQWDDPFGGEGMVPDAQPVRLDLAGRPELDGTVVIDAPFIPHLWGITGDIVVTVSGDLPRAELERVAGSLQPHRAG